MRDFSLVPDDLPERPDELRPRFARTWVFAGTLAPKQGSRAAAWPMSPTSA